MLKTPGQNAEFKLFRAQLSATAPQRPNFVIVKGVKAGSFGVNHLFTFCLRLPGKLINWRAKKRINQRPAFHG